MIHSNLSSPYPSATRDAHIVIGAFPQVNVGTADQDHDRPTGACERTFQNNNSAAASEVLGGMAAPNGGSVRVTDALICRSSDGLVRTCRCTRMRMPTEVGAVRVPGLRYPAGALSSESWVYRSAGGSAICSGWRSDHGAPPGPRISNVTRRRSWTTGLSRSVWRRRIETGFAPAL